MVVFLFILPSLGVTAPGSRGVVLWLLLTDIPGARPCWTLGMLTRRLGTPPVLIFLSMVFTLTKVPLLDVFRGHSLGQGVKRGEPPWGLHTTKDAVQQRRIGKRSTPNSRDK